MKSKITLNTSNSYILIFAITLFYFSYRYVFKWANDMTSQTYSETPIIVSAIKYFLCIILIGAALMIALYKRKVVINGSWIAVPVAICFMDAVYSLMILMNQNALMLFLGISIVVTMCITSDGKMINKGLDIVLRVFMYFNILYETIQLILYFTKGRLPAIAWSNSGIMAVRFGGAFDDPFALSLFIGFLIPYISYRYSGLKRIVLLVIHFIMLVLTWTLTTTFALLGVYIIDRLYVLVKGKKAKRNIFVLMMGAVIIIVILFEAYGKIFITELMLVKGDSITGHLRSASLGGLSFWTFLGISPEAHYSESSISRMLFTNGAPFTLCFYLVGVYSVIRFRRILNLGKQTDVFNIYEKPILYGMMYYQMAFLIGSINLPFPYMFFNLITFSVFAGVSISNYKFLGKQSV